MCFHELLGRSLPGGIPEGAKGVDMMLKDSDRVAGKEGLFHSCFGDQGEN
jgi:hypothetical protein